jgi:hypothetical protein
MTMGEATLDVVLGEKLQVWKSRIRFMYMLCMSIVYCTAPKAHDCMYVYIRIIVCCT